MKLIGALVVVAIIGVSLVDARAVRDTRYNLIVRGNALLALVDTEIKAFSASEATLIRSEEAAIQKIITQLEAATETTVVDRLEDELNQAEQRLAGELTRARLIARGSTLLARAEAAVKDLKSQNKTQQVTVIQAEEADIRKFMAALSAETEPSEIIELEGTLNRAEMRLRIELARIGFT